MFLHKNLIMYFVLSELLVFISTSSTIKLCPSSLYLRQSPMWKVGVGVLVCVDSLQAFFYELNRSMSNLCDTKYLITSFSTSGSKSIGLTVIGSYLGHMEERAKLKQEYLDIGPTILKNIEKLLKPCRISNYSIQWIE